MDIRRRILATVLGIGALLAVPAAQAQGGAAERTAAEVTKIDKAGGRLTLKHREIKNLDMPPMTMVFRVTEPRWLDTLAVGDRVMFTADKVNGQYTVTSLAKAP